MKPLKMKIDGMSCTNCAARIEKAVSGKTGINATVNFATKTLIGQYDESLWDEEKIAGLVASAGYKASIEKHCDKKVNCGCGHGDDHTSEARMWRDLWTGVILSSVLMLPSIEHLRIARLPAFMMQPWWQWILSTIVLWFVGRNFFISGVKGIRHNNLNMDVLVTIGAGTAYVYSIYQWLYYGLYKQLAPEQHYYFETAAVIVTLIFVGHYLEKRATERTTNALKDLADLKPQQARVLCNGKESMLPPDEVLVHDEILVRKGEIIPVDGIVEKGISYVNESMITGESMPVLKNKGSNVIGGTSNEGDDLFMQATKVGKDTMLAGIIRVVEEAQMKKPSIQRVADKISNIFVPTVLLIAAVTFIGWMLATGNFISAFDAAMSVVVISCPCALGLATPLSILVGTSNAAKSGILYKAGDVFERIQKIDAICFDKTGTLTEGKPSVIHYYGDQQVFSAIYSLERKVVHPIAYAMTQYAKTKNATQSHVDACHEVSGFGIEGNIAEDRFHIGSLAYMKRENCTITDEFYKLAEEASNQGNTLVFVAKNKQTVALATVADTVKANAQSLIAKLKSRGIETYMITGDNEKSAHVVASGLGINNVYANVLPVEKADYIKKIQATGKQVAFVGDGINDAPALVVADLGIALGSGANVSISSADITLVNSDLDSVDKALQLSRATLRNIYENFAWAFSYNLIAIPIAALGLLNPMFAAGFMAFSDIVVVLNAYRLRFFKPKDEKPVADKR